SDLTALCRRRPSRSSAGLPGQAGRAALREDLLMRSCTLSLLALLMASAAAAQPAPVKPQFVQDSMNVFRRFPKQDTAAMVAFYDKVLGLKPLRPIQLNSDQQIVLFGIDSGQIKLAAGMQNDSK